jgi:hypothetical protein
MPPNNTTLANATLACVLKVLSNTLATNLLLLLPTTGVQNNQ